MPADQVIADLKPWWVETDQGRKATWAPDTDAAKAKAESHGLRVTAVRPRDVGETVRSEGMIAPKNFLASDPNVDPAFVAALPGPMTRDQLYQQAQVVVFHYRNSPKLAEKIVELIQGAVRESRR